MTAVTPEDIERTRRDSLDHIAKVQARMQEAISSLIIRAARHDESKLAEPERSGYAALQANLGDIRYGTPEYRAALDAARPVIEHHYAANDHHPEHYPNGIAGMSLLSLIEMLADWKAAGERTREGSMRQSLEVNRRRFGPDDMLYGILENTARELGWVE
jgi:hypothetical protein